eukprot:TRINITY_DN578_c0_g1_i2.p1 TRINITY_DN578_c0_g1~~TRINITY_DN578_c0_g1_i2.p1  ORF type:complete len:162 (+),score=26.24 TRINITY_DN578_c0_g1_i2:224-709(+)
MDVKDIITQDQNPEAPSAPSWIFHRPHTKKERNGKLEGPDSSPPTSASEQVRAKRKRHKTENATKNERKQEAEEKIERNYSYVNLSSYQTHPPPEAKKNYYQRIPEYQRDYLEAVYANNPYPTLHAREEIATLFQTSTRRIQVWFQNRRLRSGQNHSKETT